MISDAEKAFLREYEIPNNYSFYSLHKFIQDDLGYNSDQLASFFITDEHWNKGLELTLIDMENDAGLAAIPMDSVKLSDLLKSKKDRFIYVFDIFSDRCFFIELAEITEPAEGKDYPYCKVSIGTPPEQIVLDVVSITDILDDDNFDEITNEIDMDSLDSEEYSDQDFY